MPASLKQAPVLQMWLNVPSPGAQHRAQLFRARSLSRVFWGLACSPMAQYGAGVWGCRVPSTSWGKGCVQGRGHMTAAAMDTFWLPGPQMKRRVHLGLAFTK